MSVDHDIQAIQSIEAVPHIMGMLSEVTGLRFICVARVTDNQWKACSVLDNINFNLKAGDELNVKTTLCEKVRSSAEPVIIEQASTDTQYSSSDVPVMYGFESYFSYPIYDKNGDFFGTICGLDPLPAKLKTPLIENQICSFAELISRQIQAEDRLTRTESELFNEQTAVKLREQYIAILGHDLRTPLSSVSMGIEFMKDYINDETVQKVLAKMDSSTTRMSRLISDVMDFTHGKMGQGIPLKRKTVSNLGSVISYTVSELAELHPECDIDANIDITGTFHCDPERISQLLSNLLVNAIVHGDKSQPIRITGHTQNSQLTLTVANSGKPIAPEIIERLFQPFWRETHSSRNQGLGLGLFIASQIADAHGGHLSVESNLRQTRFNFKAML